MERRVVLYSQPGCFFCRLAKEFLDEKGVKYEERDITEDATALAELDARGVMATPVIVVDGEMVVGFDRQRLTALLG